MSAGYEAWSEDFEWDAGNVSHIARHNVAPSEAEEALLHDPHDFAYEVIDGEERFSYVGMTERGRFLFVVITERLHRVRVVTAYDAPKEAVLEYLRRG